MVIDVRGGKLIVLESNADRENHSRLYLEMLEQRARVFGPAGKNWAVTIRYGLEWDELDEELAPVYILFVDEVGRLMGSTRMLPTTGPTLLSTSFSKTFAVSASICAPSIWECSRICLECRPGKEAAEKAALVSRSLFVGIGHVALKAGVESVLGIFEAPMYRLYRRIQLEVSVIEKFQTPTGMLYSGSFTVSQEILKRVSAGVMS